MHFFISYLTKKYNDNSIDAPLFDRQVPVVEFVDYLIDCGFPEINIKRNYSYKRENQEYKGVLLDFKGVKNFTVKKISKAFGRYEWILLYNTDHPLVKTLFPSELKTALLSPKEYKKYLTPGTIVKEAPTKAIENPLHDQLLKLMDEVNLFNAKRCFVNKEKKQLIEDLYNQYDYYSHTHPRDTIIGIEAKNFLLIALQRSTIGFTNTTKTGMLVKHLLNDEKYRDLKKALFPQLEPEAAVRYRDLRELVSGSQNSQKLFFASNKNKLFSLFTPNKLKPCNAFYPLSREEITGHVKRVLGPK